MVVLSRPSLTLLAFAILLSGEAVDVLDLPTNGHNDLGSAPFYKSLASKVDSLVVSADFSKREQAHRLTVPPAKAGAQDLKHWTAVYQSGQPLVNASDLGTELGGYALQLRDQGRLRTAAQAHAAMRKAASTHVLTKESLDSGSAVGSDAADAGRAFLKQWSASHAHGVVAASAPQQAVQKASTPSHDSKNKRQAFVHPVEHQQSKAFMHAHSMMHGFESETLKTVMDSVADGDAKGALVSSGGELLSNWENDQGLKVVKASIRKDLALAPSTPPQSIAASEAIHDSESPRSTIRMDLESLRSSTHDWRSQAPQEGEQIGVRQAISQDKEDLKKEVREMSSRSSQLHKAMHDFGDVQAVASPVQEQTVQSEADLKEGDDELQKWAKAHTSKQVVVNQAKTLSRPSTAASLPEPVLVKSITAATVPKDIVNVRATVQDLRRSEVHDAMRSITSDVPELAGSETASPQVSETLKEAGVDALDQWSKAHEPKRVPMFAKREALLSPSAFASAPEHVEVADQRTEPNDVEQMQASVSKWHGSSMHDAMRGIGGDAPDLDLQATPVLSMTKSGEAAGADALDEWSRVHKPAQSPKFMPPVSTAAQMQPLPQAIISPASVAPHQNLVPEEGDGIQASVRKWHISSLHDAMRSIGNDAPDAEPADSQLPVPKANSNEAGADVLARWSQAHQKPRTPKFVVPLTHEDQTQASSIAAPEAPPHVEQGSDVAEDWRASTKKLHQSAVHEAMQKLSSDVPDMDTSDSQPQSIDEAKAVGADMLDGWSKAHDKSHSSKFLMPVVAEQQMPSSSVPTPVEEQKQEAIKSPGSEQVQDVHSSLKQLHRSEVHEAMRNIGSDVPDTPTEAQVQVQPALHENGEGVMENWSASHSETKRPKRTPLVDMYPPTAAPGVDMVALAFSRGFGKKAAESLEAPISKAAQLHAAMQSMDVNSGSVAEAIGHSDVEAATSTGADILSQWSKTHK